MDHALADGLDRTWRLLAAAVRDPRAALRLLVVATVGPAGPEARTLVLRGVDSSARTLRFFTDVRSAKVAAIAARPAVAVVGYDPALGLQLTFHGAATIATTGNDVDADWGTVRPRAYRDYLGGISVSEADDAAIARANFAVLTICVDRAEWLELSHGGNTRAGYRYEAGEWLGRPLV
ncbi:MAG: pyridoxamine 5'-phosphate oxidase family protein [Janthinobacterium lividum]